MAELDQASRKLKLIPTLAERGSGLVSGERQLATLDALDLGSHGSNGNGSASGSAVGRFEAQLERAGLAPLCATGVEVFQINVGRVCNQTCAHCHVDAGPTRTEIMSRETAELCMRTLAATKIPTVDITGGAPELCPSFRYLVEESRRLGRHVLDRCNLTILTVPRFADLPAFFAEHQVEVVCSLPHYRELSTDRQRGIGVFESSIEGLRLLNAVGYGREGSGLKLVLVTNPVGAFLPNTSPTLVLEWKRELKREFGIEFNELHTITNMPISRYLEWLDESGNLEGYMRRLVDAFNPVAAAGVMCRSSLSVGWEGQLFDCDFNQMLELELDSDAPKHLRDFDLAALATRQIVTGRHCFGCTAGAGSSCGGSIA